MTSGERLREVGVPPARRAGGQTNPFKLFICVQCGFEYDEAKGWPEDGIAPGIVYAPRGPPTGPDRVLRGGSWRRLGVWARTAARERLPEGERQLDVGFRCAEDGRM